MRAQFILTLWLAGMLTMGLASCQKSGDEQPAAPEQTSKTAGERMEQAAEAAGEAAEKVGETARAAAEKVGQTSREVAGKAAKATAAAAESTRKAAEELAQKAADLAPSFSLEDDTGKTVKLSDFAGKLVVLEWVNPECPFIQRHVKAGTMADLAEAYGPRGVTFLAVNSTRTYDVAKNHAWREEHELPYPVLDDHGGAVGDMFDAKTTPHLFIIDRTGKIVYRGAIDDDRAGTKGDQAVNYVKVVLDDLLAGNAPSITETQPYGCSVKYAD